MDAGGELPGNVRQALGHKLPVAIEIGGRVEIDLDIGQSLDRGRRYPLQVWRAVDRRLDRPGDDGLDLLRRKTGRFGLYIHLRWCEFRESVIARLAEAI